MKQLTAIVLLLTLSAGPAAAFNTGGMATGNGWDALVHRIAGPKCLKYVVKKKCVKMRIHAEDLKTAPGPDPERSVEITLREKCEKWADERLCVKWQGGGPDMLPGPGR